MIVGVYTAFSLQVCSLRLKINKQLKMLNQIKNYWQFLLTVYVMITMTVGVRNTHTVDNEHVHST